MTRNNCVREKTQAPAYSERAADQGLDHGVYWLDIQYEAFKDDVEFLPRNFTNQLKQTRRTLSGHKFKRWEEYEIENGSSWRGNYLQEISRNRTESPSKEERYGVWTRMHHDAIDALEGHFLRNNYASEMDSIRNKLLHLWNFLPQEFYKYGTGAKLQKRQVRWLTKKTDLTERHQIDKFLENLVSNFCSRDKGELINRLRVFDGGFEDHPESVSIEGDRDKLMTDMLESGAYKTTVKRLLLQTPLLFWPAVFKPGVSRFLEERVKPCEVLYSTYGDLVVLCSNMQLRGGSEVLALWENLLKYEDSMKIHECPRFYELRWEQVPLALHQKFKSEQNMVQGHRNTMNRAIWRPKLRHWNAI
jgi:hypothetical protein